MSSSISRQLIFWLAVPLMLLALCGALVHYFNHIAPTVIDSDRRLRETTNAVMAHLQTSGGRPAFDAGNSSLPPLPSPDSAVYAIRDARGAFIGGNELLRGATLGADSGQIIAMTRFEHRTVRSLTTRFDTPGGMIFITVADVSTPAEPAARYGFMSTLLWDFVQLDVTLVLVWVGIQLGLRPIKKLRDEIAARSPQDLRSIGEASVPREIAPVVVTLNRLFSTLRSSVQSQQQFIANTAHQLRTPITGLQAQLDLLVAEPAAEPVEHRLRVLQEGVRQLAHSANQLLALARTDPTVNLVTRNQPVDLSALAREVVARFIDRALACDIDLGLDVGSQAADVSADPALLDDLLSNLVDNGLKYTPAGGRVTVSVGVRGGDAFLAVEDTGPGIPADERQHVKQRFYRLPNSPGHGSGLGLAIVDEIAKLYGARLRIDSGIDHVGTAIEVRFMGSAAT